MHYMHIAVIYISIICISRFLQHVFHICKKSCDVEDFASSRLVRCMSVEILLFFFL